jgi:hypothetical protein
LWYLWRLLAIFYHRQVPFPLIMKVQVYWSEITHYTGEIEIPFEDLDTKEAQEYIEQNLPHDRAKDVGFEIEHDSVDAFEVS